MIAIDPRFGDPVGPGEPEVKAAVAALQSLPKQIDEADGTTHCTS